MFTTIVSVWCTDKIIWYRLLSIVFLFSRNRREDSISDGVECESDSWSDDDSGSDNMSRSISNNSSKSWDAISDDSSSDQDGSCQKKDKLGYLYLNYTELTSPYMRVPLMEKVTFLFSISSCSIYFSSPHLSSNIIRCNCMMPLHYTSN